MHYLPRSSFLRSFSSSPFVTPPIWFMRQAGRHLPEYKELRRKSPDFLSFCYNSNYATEATLQPVERYDMDAAILFSDILTIPDALGQSVSFQEKIGPVLTPVQQESDLEKLSLKGFKNHLSPVYKTVKTVRQKLDADKALIGFSGSPWTLAAYMIEGHGKTNFEKARYISMKSPIFFQKLIDLLTECVINHLVQQIEHGADAVQLFDSWAGLLDEESLHKFVFQPTAKIVAAIKYRFSKVPVIGFPKGIGTLYKDYILETSVDAIGIDQTVSLSYAERILQPLATIQGNLNNIALLCGGQKNGAGSFKDSETFSATPFIFNLNHGVLPETPVENIYRVVHIVQNYQG